MLWIDPFNFLLFFGRKFLMFNAYFLFVLPYIYDLKKCFHNIFIFMIRIFIILLTGKQNCTPTSNVLDAAIIMTTATVVEKAALLFVVTAVQLLSIYRYLYFFSL